MKHYIFSGFLGFLFGNTLLAAGMLIASQIVYQSEGKVFFVGFIESGWTQVENVLTPTLPANKRR
jgi:hypothetical protein